MHNHKIMACRRAFVTGGGGYVGSSLCRRLVERGYTVSAFDLHYPEPEEEQNDSIHRVKVWQPLEPHHEN